jgi:hypothetical protein
LERSRHPFSVKGNPGVTFIEFSWLAKLFRHLLVLYMIALLLIPGGASIAARAITLFLERHFGGVRNI